MNLLAAIEIAGEAVAQDKHDRYCLTLLRLEPHRIVGTDGVLLVVVSCDLQELTEPIHMTVAQAKVYAALPTQELRAAYVDAVRARQSSLAYPSYQKNLALVNPVYTFYLNPDYLADLMSAVSVEAGVVRLDVYPRAEGAYSTQPPLKITVENWDGKERPDAPTVEMEAVLMPIQPHERITPDGALGFHEAVAVRQWATDIAMMQRPWYGEPESSCALNSTENSKHA